VSNSSSSTGFTLAEVLVALASVSVLVAGAAGLLSTASVATRSARNSTTATLLATQKVEQLGAMAALPPSGTAQDYFGADGRPASAASAIFTRRWTVTAAWASSVNAAVVVEVFVSGAGRAAEVQAVIGAGGASEP
jgi:Tfp pilus assembly protein PilV